MKLEVKKNKTLKLTNVIILSVAEENMENFQFNVEIEKMKNYIAVHGAKQVGPLIQHSETKKESDGKIKIILEFMLQCDRIIHNIGEGYKQKPLIKVQNCMFCHYDGLEEAVRFAKEKIEITAFEEDEVIRGDCYTVYIDFDQDKERIIADVFMPIEG